MSDASSTVDYKELVRDDRIHASLYTDPRIFEDEMERIFYGWTYGLSGELLGVPYPGGYASLDKTARGLARVPRVASYRGFVLASFAETGVPLAEHLGELSIQAKHEMHWWVGHTTHALRLVEGVLRMSRKKVVLINAAEPLPNLSFLI